MVHATCAALHCLSSSHTDKDLKFHQFPHDKERRKIWLVACKRSDVIDKDRDFFKHKYVCSLHFQKCMYSKKGHLKKSAIPSLHLSEKPLQHDSSTQTVESIQYVNQQSENDVKILYVMPNVEKSSTTTYTQTEDSLPDDIRHINIKQEIITQTIIGEFESVEQDVEIKTENDDDYGEDSDSGAFEEDVEMKTEIVENEILPLVKSTPSLQSDLEMTKDGGTLSTQAKNLLQEIDQGSKGTILNRTESSVGTNPINASMKPILKRKMDESIQTERVIALSLNADVGEGSINPEECTCNRNNYADMTRLQFYRACSKFLSANFAMTVRRQMHLDDFNNPGQNKLCEAGSSGSIKASAAECIEWNAASCGGVVAPDVAIASTETADSTEVDLYAADRVEASAAANAADCARRRTEWIKACKRIDLMDKPPTFFKKKYVCSLHFLKSMYKNKYLQRFATPSLHWTTPSRDSCTQTWVSLKFLGPTPDISKIPAVPDLKKIEVRTSHTQTEELILCPDHNLEYKKQNDITCTTIEERNMQCDELEIKSESKIKEDESSKISIDDFIQINEELENQLRELKKEYIPHTPIKKETNSIHKGIQTDFVITIRIPKNNKCFQQCLRCGKNASRIAPKQVKLDHLITLEDFETACERFLPPAFCATVKNQIQIEHRRKTPLNDV